MTESTRHDGRSDHDSQTESVFLPVDEPLSVEQKPHFNQLAGWKKSKEEQKKSTKQNLKTTSSTDDNNRARHSQLTVVPYAIRLAIILQSNQCRNSHMRVKYDNVNKMWRAVEWEGPTSTWVICLVSANARPSIVPFIGWLDCGQRTIKETVLIWTTQPYFRQMQSNEINLFGAPADFVHRENSNGTIVSILIFRSMEICTTWRSANGHSYLSTWAMARLKKKRRKMEEKAPNRIAIALYSEFLHRSLIPSIQMRGCIMDHGKSLSGSQHYLHCHYYCSR